MLEMTSRQHRRSSLLGDGVMMPSVRGSIESRLTGGDFLSHSAPSTLLSTQSAAVFHGSDIQQSDQKQVGACGGDSLFPLDIYVV